MPDNLFKARREHQALVQRLREAFPEASDADLADSIEGESSLAEAIMLTLRAANETEATAAGLKAYIDKLFERYDLLWVRSERLRQAALQAAQEAALPMPLKAADFTASIARGKAKVQITGDVPDSFCRVKKEPDKTAIGDALNAGVKLPFATLGNPVPHWTIRTR